jgi:hypothetical protein
MTAHPHPFPSHDQIAVADAAAHLRCAARLLREAQFRVDEAELGCSALDDLAADAAALAAEWAGRSVAPLHSTPAYIGEAAKSWRHSQGRGY